MARKNSNPIKIKRPGALTAKAAKVGMKPMAFARLHKSSPGLTGQQARAAIIMSKWNKK